MHVSVWVTLNHCTEGDLLDLRGIVRPQVPNEGLADLITQRQELVPIVQAESHVPDITVAHFQP